jgi:hypothetical protein
MTSPNVDVDTDEAKEIIDLYRTIDETKIRELSYMDLSMLDIRDRSKVDMQLEFNARRQCKKFVDYIDKPKEYIVDILVKALRTDINKDTLWRLFGDVIYDNIERNLEDTRICIKCGVRFTMDYHNQQLCDACSTYQPIISKTIICIDCGEEVEIDALSRAIRCNKCQKIERQRINRQNYLKTKQNSD